MMNDPISGQISYNYCLSDAFKLKVGYDWNIFWIEMKNAAGKELAEHVIRPAKVIPTSYVKARCGQQIIIVHTPWNVQMIVEQRMERRMVGKRMILVWK